MHRFLSSLCVVLTFIVAFASGQGGYVVRGPAKVINGHTIRVGGVDVTLSGVDPVDGYDSSAARSLKRRIGKSDVGCMVDGNWCVLLTCERRTVRPSLALPPPLTRSQVWQELGLLRRPEEGPHEGRHEDAQRLRGRPGLGQERQKLEPLQLARVQGPEAKEGNVAQILTRIRLI